MRKAGAIFRNGRLVLTAVCYVSHHGSLTCSVATPGRSTGFSLNITRVGRGYRTINYCAVKSIKSSLLRIQRPEGIRLGQSLISATAHRSSKRLTKFPGSGDLEITESLEPRSFNE